MKIHDVGYINYPTDFFYIRTVTREKALLLEIYKVLTGNHFFGQIFSDMKTIAFGQVPPMIYKGGCSERHFRTQTKTEP